MVHFTTKNYIKMRKMLKISILCSLLLTIGAISSIDAQSYLSKPQAMQNLIDENNYLRATLPGLENSDPDQFQLGTQKQLIIVRMLNDLKRGALLEEAVALHLPNGDGTKIQLGGIRVKTPDNEKNRLEWFRNEILRLITY